MEANESRHDSRPPALPVGPVREYAWFMPYLTSSLGTADAGDRLDRSDSGSGMSEIPGQTPSPETLSAERLIELRRRIQDRFHDSPDVAEKVARRILERGDL